MKYLLGVLATLVKKYGQLHYNNMVLAAWLIKLHNILSIVSAFAWHQFYFQFEPNATKNDDIIGLILLIQLNSNRKFH
jgi:hypothetical protein